MPKGLPVPYLERAERQRLDAMVRAATPKMLEALLGIYYNENTPDRTKVAIAALLLPYGWGKAPTMHITASTSDKPELRKIVYEVRHKHQDAAEPGALSGNGSGNGSDGPK